MENVLNFEDIVLFGNYMNNFKFKTKIGSWAFGAIVCSSCSTWGLGELVLLTMPTSHHKASGEG